METPFYGDEALSGLGGGGSGSGGSFASPGRLFPGAPPTAAAAGSMMKKDALTLSLSEQVAAALKPGAAPPPAPLRADGAPSTAPPDGLLASPDLGAQPPPGAGVIIQSNAVPLFPRAAAWMPSEPLPAAAAAARRARRPAAAAGRAVAERPGRRAPERRYSERAAYAAARGRGARDGAFPPAVFAAPPPGALGRRACPRSRMTQTVPTAELVGESPPLSPLTMTRRIASRRIAQAASWTDLAPRRDETLKSQNTELASTASLLREQVAQLKQKVLSHVNSGCQLLPQHQVPAY
uniref:JunD proto-onco, AP-1 transcription factor subunit n=1 Tax=Microcebus murinus TaxID=30608 RepID=A0A8C5VL44_MICMU